MQESEPQAVQHVFITPLEEIESLALCSHKIGGTGRSGASDWTQPHRSVL